MATNVHLLFVKMKFKYQWKVFEDNEDINNFINLVKKYFEMNIKLEEEEENDEEDVGGENHGRFLKMDRWTEGHPIVNQLHSKRTFTFKRIIWD